MTILFGMKNREANEFPVFCLTIANIWVGTRHQSDNFIHQNPVDAVPKMGAVSTRVSITGEKIMNERQSEAGGRGTPVSLTPNGMIFSET